MIEFATANNKSYRLPKDLIENAGGYFKLIKDGDVIGLTSNQFDFLFFGLDRFNLEEFSNSVHTIFQLSNIDFDKKVLMKLKNICESEERNRAEENRARKKLTKPTQLLY